MILEVDHDWIHLKLIFNFTKRMAGLQIGIIRN